ncbi:FecR family protein [Duganella sp. CF402]|uniref:FecR family protein n=1 Tax=unclassified Duganella TaxID=2636909 RepID=UPI0008AB80FB|nr:MULTISPECIES: FecR family protein [unclassified Duganella]RZT08690.1 FecR family protein [Duganella sp. BK701]SEL85297.1 FecR family protein [Duganella sp. CF402]
MLRKYLTGAALLLAALSPAWAGEAGRIVFVTGRADLGGQPAKLDAVVNEGAELSTGSDGYMYIKTLDAGMLILRPNTRARVADYKFDPAHPSATRVKLELLSGVARAISGQGVKQARQNFRFNTPVAAIGVRGTDFIVYTDAETSRVSVVSGGVVVSPFAGSCTAEGAGPCEGQASRELFAGQAGMLLQVRRGQATPQLLNNPALSPDQNEKPRADEPVGKVAMSSVLPATQVNLDPQKSELSLGAVHTTTEGTTAPVDPVLPVTPPVVTPPPVVVTPPVTEPIAPKAQEVFWGRWSTVAGAAVMPASIQNNATDATAFVGNYAVARLKGAQLVMPTEGTVAFTLNGSEAFVQKTGMAESLAAVETGQLSINFVDRSFTTGLVVAADGAKYNVNGKGVVDMSGLMSNVISSPTTIRGYLSGTKVEEAAYIFKNVAYPGTTITGATSWKR